MLSNRQKSIIKMAQRQIGLNDQDYREILHTVTGATSSTDPRLGDEAFDRVLKYMEAVYWLKVHKGELQHICKPGAVFMKKGYWAGKNMPGDTSRDRFVGDQVSTQIVELEQAFGELGLGQEYVGAIRKRATRGRTDNQALQNYRAALERTLARKHQQRAGNVEEPF